MIAKLLLVALLVAPSASLVTLPKPSKCLGGTSPSCNGILRQRPSALATRLAASTVGGAIGDDDGEADGSASGPLPRELAPITLGVFAQMLGEGISLSSLPLYLTRLGASPLTVGLAISCFSVAQMTFAPILVGLSSRLGRSKVLRLCLSGAAASSLLIAFSGTASGVIAGRTLAGVFAACVPVAQSGVTDILTGDERVALGLSRVSAASQLGVVVGPAASALFQSGFAAAGLASSRRLPAVFVLNAVFALSVLAQMTLLDRRQRRGQSSPLEPVADDASPERAEPSATTTEEKRAEVAAPAEAEYQGPGSRTLRLSQPMLRTVTIVVGWTAILSNSIYGLFAPRFLGFRQPQLSATYSAAAALMVGTQIGFPRIVSKLGEHKACALGILAAGTGIGGQALVRFQPFHTALYMLGRAGAAVADTSTAALVASASGKNREARSRNLALLTSTRAAARIATPLLSSKMFELSCRSSVAPGALPFVTAACFALAVAPLPTLLLKAERRRKAA